MGSIPVGEIKHHISGRGISNTWKKGLYVTDPTSSSLHCSRLLEKRYAIEDIYHSLAAVSWMGGGTSQAGPFGLLERLSP